MPLAPDHRRRELAQIHIAKKQLALDDDTYRAMLWTVARAHSSGDLDFAGRSRVLEHLKRCGFAPLQPKGGNAEWGWIDRAADDKRRMLRKIVALLRAATPPRGRAYADAMCGKMFHAARLEFCAPDQLHKLIAALVFDARRHN